MVGVDGCRGGWVVAADRGGDTEVLVLPSFSEVLGLGAALVGVDMPVGLPSDAPRACDVVARALLGPRRASVFPAPVRAVLRARHHAAAVARSRAACGRGISIQAWNLVPKVVEVDDAIEPGDPVWEVHPELSFATLAGAPLATSKHGRAGRAERLALLGAVFPDVATRLEAAPPGCAAHDVLDAYAVLWTVRRIAAGTATSVGDGALDERGLPMRITT